MTSPAEQFNRAKAALAAGNRETARTIFLQLAQAHPNSAETYFFLGGIELSDGKAKRAKKYLLKAVKLRPTQPAIWMSLMDAEIALKDKSGVGKLLRQAKAAGLPINILKQLQSKAQTNNRQGLANLGGASVENFTRVRTAYERGNFENAQKMAAALLEKHPRSAPLHAIHAASLTQMGQNEAAKISFGMALQIDPGYFEAHLQLGQLLMALGDTDGASTHLSKALELARESPDAHLSLGILHARMNGHNKAVEYLETARKSLHNDPRLQLYLAQSYQAVARTKEARIALSEARKHTLREDEQVIVVKTLLDMNLIDEAGELLDVLLAKNPDSIEILKTRIHFDTTTGNVEGMRTIVRSLLEKGTSVGGFLLTYARSGKMSKDDPIPAEMEKAYTSEQDPDAKNSLAFALAKVYEDWDDYKKSFSYLSHANDIERAKATLEAEAKSIPFELAKRTFERRAKMPAKAENTTGTLATNTPKSIQITGMPRSGTTLVEQIISSHSTVTASGEVGIIGQRARDGLEIHDFENHALTPDELQEFGAGITQAYGRMFPDADVVTDKAIMSNVFAGIYAQAVPDSRMVVLRRDPRDNCLSIYKNKFKSGTHTYSTDLEALGRQYLLFLEVQAYWHEKAPDSYYEIQYESLVANPEEEARALIDYCGLEWEDACLEFYKNNRKVATLSAFQVRQPMYSSSVAAWKRYEEELQPLIKILDEGGALEGY